MDMWVATAKASDNENVAPDICYRWCGAWCAIDRCGYRYMVCRKVFHNVLDFYNFCVIMICCIFYYLLRVLLMHIFAVTLLTYLLLVG